MSSIGDYGHQIEASSREFIVGFYLKFFGIVEDLKSSVSFIKQRDRCEQVVLLL